MKFIVVNGRKILSMITLFVVFVMSIFCASISNVQSVNSAAEKLVPIYCVNRDDKKIALTFDAAWGADKTKQIVDILVSKNAVGSFFLVEFWTEKYPDLVSYIHDNGFDIGTHSSTHPKMSTLSYEQTKLELEQSSERITSITGEKVVFFRPPFGDYNNTLISTADELGLKTIQWSIDSLDWMDYDYNSIWSKIEKGLTGTGGDIILFHNNSTYILDALPKIIDNLLADGYELTTLSNVVYDSDYTINSQGIQIKNLGG